MHPGRAYPAVSILFHGETGGVRSVDRRIEAGADCEFLLISHPQPDLGPPLDGVTRLTAPFFCLKPAPASVLDACRSIPHVAPPQAAARIPRGLPDDPAFVPAASPSGPAACDAFDGADADGLCPGCRCTGRRDPGAP